MLNTFRRLLGPAKKGVLGAIFAGVLVCGPVAGLFAQAKKAPSANSGAESAADSGTESAADSGTESAAGAGSQSGAEPSQGAGSTAVLKINMDEAVRLALQNNLNLKSAAVQLDIKYRANKYKWNQFIPSLNVSANANRGWASVANSFITMADTIDSWGTLNGLIGSSLSSRPEYKDIKARSSSGAYMWSGAITMSATWNLPFVAMASGLKALKQDYQSGVISYNKARTSIEKSIRQSYYQLLLAQESLKLYEAQLKTAEQQTTQSRTSYNNGLVPETTYLQAQVQAANLQPTVENGKMVISKAMASFADALGLPYDTVFELEPVKEAIPDIKLNEKKLIQQAISNSPDILESQSQIATQKTQRTAQALQAWTPVLSLGITGSPSLANFEFSNQMTWGGGFSIGLSWQLNGLIPWFKQGQTIKNLDAQLKISNINLANLINQTRINVHNTVLDLNLQKTNAASSEATLNRARRSEQQAQIAYNNGNMTYVEYQNTVNQRMEAEIGLLSYKFNYLQDLISLEYYLGIPFGSMSKGENQ
jgi:outer membrane protein TolC